MPSRFPQAFERFESQYPVKGYDTLQEYLIAFEGWQKYHSTNKQKNSFYIECELNDYFKAPYNVKTEKAIKEEKQFGIEVNKLFVRFESVRTSKKTGKEYKQTQWRNTKTGRFASNPYQT